MKINCIIVEDEPLALERAKNYVLKIAQLHLLATFDNAHAALTFLKSSTVNLVFLDINLGELSGIQLLESAQTNAKIIITTAYQEFALKGFELNVTDYLLKPYTFERFFQAVERVRIELEKNIPVTGKDYIFVKTEYRLEKISLPEIIYIEGMRDYRRIHTTTKKIMTLQTFKDFEAQISSEIIFRVHKSFMVAIDKIESIERDEIKIGEIFIPVSETYKKPFFELIKQRK
ncbi:LytTR family DNA-binding domain-containing protein [soil metagenome]